MAMPAKGLLRPLVKLCTITSALSGVPSWKVMFGRSVTVHFVWSALGVIDLARYGTTAPLAPMANSGS